MDKQEILLKQYEIFVKTADDITVRRLQTNKFYLAILWFCWWLCCKFFDRLSKTYHLFYQQSLVNLSYLS